MERYLEEYNQLIGIFPEEIWRLISERLCADSFKALLDSSPAFHTILQGKIVKFLFPKVLPMLIPHMDGGGEGGMTLRVLRSILTCRLVCKDWASNVDNMLNNRRRYVHTNDLLEICVRNCNTTLWTAGSEDNLTSFVNHFHETHLITSTRSPFISRRLLLWFDEDEDSMNFLYNLQPIFVKYGVHIKQLQIYYQDEIDPYINNIISRLIVRLPNLEWLSIENNSSMTPRFFPIDIVELQPMEKLSVLKLNDVSVPFVDELFVRSRQLYKVDIYTRVLLNGNYNMAQILTLPLTSFRLSFTSGQQYQRFVQTVKQATGAPWRLKSLKFRFDDRQTRRTFVPPADIWTTLETNWQTTLECLVVNMPEPRTPENVATNLAYYNHYQMDLPLLNKLKLNMYNQTHVDFLLGIKNSLVDLDISVVCRICGECTARKCHDYGDKPWEVERVIQFSGFENRMLDSNIWTCLPKLERLAVLAANRHTSNNYTRQAWLRNRLFNAQHLN